MILVLLRRLCFSEAVLYVWGSNSFGQLGIGQIGGCITRPTLCEVSLTFDVVMEMLCLFIIWDSGRSWKSWTKFKRDFGCLCYS